MNINDDYLMTSIIICSSLIIICRDGVSMFSSILNEGFESLFFFNIYLKTKDNYLKTKDNHLKQKMITDNEKWPQKAK